VLPQGDDADARVEGWFRRDLAIGWGRPVGGAEQIAHLVRKGGRLLAHGSDFGAIKNALPVYAKTIAEGVALGS
jgi:hypothetical protein